MMALKHWANYLAETGTELYRDARQPWPDAKAIATATNAAPSTAEAQEPLTAWPAPSPRRETLADILQEMGNCQRCKLGATRNNLVFGEGDPNAKLMFVGEGPGADEDRLGRPFVGAAGQLLDKMITAMGLKREQVYIANIVKSRPPNNRDPEPDEIGACFPFLQRQIRAIGPQVIVTLGKPAARTLLKLDGPISVYRGVWQRYEGTPAMPTFHPAYLLRNAAEKRNAWKDLQAVMLRLGLTPRSGA